MKTVGEVSKITGVSIRTLHHYDAIGLLKPSGVTESGYRLYDEKALERLQCILLFRELQIPLKEIGKIIDNPEFNKNEALEMQIKMLEMQYEHIGNLISFAREIKEKGVTAMNFKVFDKSKMEKYAAEAKEKWGNTEAYQEYEKKSVNKSEIQERAEADGLMEIFSRFGAIKKALPEGEEAQNLVSELKEYITNHYYTCTDEILFVLGKMYSAEGEMKENIDNAGGEGTADFASKAIEYFCK